MIRSGVQTTIPADEVTATVKEASRGGVVWPPEETGVQYETTALSAALLHPSLEAVLRSKLIPRCKDRAQQGDKRCLATLPTVTVSWPCSFGTNLCLDPSSRQPARQAC